MRRNRQDAALPHNQSRTKRLHALGRDDNVRYMRPKQVLRMRNETKLISDKAKADALTALVKAKQPRKKPCKECGFGKYPDKETNPATPKSKAGSKAESKEKAQTPTPPARESRRLSKSDTEDILMGCSATDVNNQYFVSVAARKVQFKKLLSAPTGSKADTVETAATVPDKAIRATFNKNTRDKITQALGKNCTHSRVPDIQPHGEAHDSAMVFQARRIRHHQDRRRTERPQPRCYRGRRRRGNDHHSQLENKKCAILFSCQRANGRVQPALQSARREQPRSSDG